MLKKLLLSQILFLIFVLSVSGQEELLYLPIDVEFKDVRLDSALNILEVKTNLYFTYDASKVDINRKINANFVYTTLSIVLDSIIRDPFLSYKFIGKHLIIFRDQKLITEQKDTASLKSVNRDLILRGIIIKAQTRIPLPYVNIGVQNTSLGTVSNENGEFILKLNSKLISDTLVFSSIGFESRNIVIDKIGETTIIELKPSIIPLQEIVIRHTEPKSLVKIAIQNKKNNYSSNASILRCFYREIMTRNNKYKLYTEGLLDIYKSPYRPTLYNDQIKLLKRRRFSNIVEEDTVQFKLHGGLKTCLDLDLIKHPLEFIQIHSLDSYKYQLIDIVTFDERLLYQIDFAPKKESNNLSFEGSIFIDIMNMAIVKLEFNYTSKSLRKARNAFILRRSRSIKVNISKASYEISYKNLDGKYYINRIYGKLKLRVKKKNKFLASNFETSFELVTTDIQLQDIDRFIRKETVRPNKIFTEMSASYDPNFWNGDNFIIPERDLSKALNRFKLEELKIKEE